MHVHEWAVVAYACVTIVNTQNLLLWSQTLENGGCFFFFLMYVFIIDTGSLFSIEYFGL